MTLQTQIEDALRDAVVAVLGEKYREADPLVRPATDARFGDFQANLAMGLAKRVGQKPRELAERLVASLPPDSQKLIASAEVAGPGFINLTLTEAAVNDAAAAMLADPRVGVPEANPPLTIAIDYSGPNVAKEMHVGHLRSTVIGDALARTLAFQGHRVIRRNHLGDWGTQFGMLIEHLRDNSIQSTADAPREISDLNDLYKAAQARFQNEEGFADRARERVVKLQGGDIETLELWRQLVDESMRHFEENYARLNVLLQSGDAVGESSYNDQLPGVVGRLNEAGLLETSQGAEVVFPQGFMDRDGEPLPMIVRKSDGGFLYATTDLAAALHRIEELHADRLIYVTDSRQTQHFAMVFATLAAAGWSEQARLDHVAFGTILGPDHKPFKTRSGETVKLRDLLDEAVERALTVVREKNPDLPEKQATEIARVIGIGGLKYADLSNDRIKDYVFDWDRMLALEGNTAPYLQYSYTRIQSIFRKGEIAPEVAYEFSIQARDPAERTLVLQLAQLPVVVEGLAESLEPHRLCTYLYELAAAFHGFYERCPVLTAEDDATRESRLALCVLTAKTLRLGLELLGIEVLERM